MKHVSLLTVWLGLGIAFLGSLALLAVLAARHRKAAARQQPAGNAVEAHMNRLASAHPLASHLLFGLQVALSFGGLLFIVVLTVHLAALVLCLLAFYSVFVLPALIMLVPVLLLVCLLVVATCFSLYWLARYGYRSYLDGKANWQMQQLSWRLPIPPPPSRTSPFRGRSAGLNTDCTPDPPPGNFFA